MTQEDGYRELLRVSLRITDVRSDHGKRHNLTEVIFMVVVALLGGAQNAEDVVGFAKRNLNWFKQFLILVHGVPAHDTVLRILALVKPPEMEGVVRAWTLALREPGALTVDGGHLAFDGQTLRGSADKRLGLSGIDMVSAYLVGSGVVLGSERVDDKSNEIIAIPNLIRSLDLRGATVTIDAIACQHKIAAALREAEAHYILQVKENQPTLLKNIEDSVTQAARRRRPGEAPVQIARHREVDKGHGRIETRSCVLLRDLSGIENAQQWRDLAGIVAMRREREDVLSGKKSLETSYFIISNGTATLAEIAKTIRNHWAIENGLHWSMDVVWGSDGHKVRERTAAENLARLRRFCGGLVKQATGWGMSGRRVRMECGWDPDENLRVLVGEVISRERVRRPNRKDVGRYGQGVRKAT